MSDSLPDRQPIEQDAEEILVTAARRFLVLHPDVQVVGLTVVSRTINPEVLSTILVGGQGGIVTPDLWILCALRLLEAIQYCNENVKGLLLGLEDLTNNMARTVEGLRDEQARLQEAQALPHSSEFDHGTS